MRDPDSLPARAPGAPAPAPGPRAREPGADGELGAEDLVPLLYDELRRRARAALRGERPGHTLQATALVNEVWLQLAGEGRLHPGADPGEHPAADPAMDRAGFLRAASRAMRRLLVDHARRAGAAKRGGERERVPLEEGLALAALLPPPANERLLGLHAALERLGEIHPRYERIVELRFFGGLSHPEIARVLGTSLRDVERGWAFSRSWLHRRLTEEDDGA